MNFFTKTIIGIVSISLLGGCATLIYGTKEPILVTSNPKDVEVYINNVYEGNTPTIATRKFHSGRQILSIRLSDAKEDKYNVTLPKKFRPISLVGLPLIVPFAIDLVTGAAYASDPIAITHNFENQSENLAWNYKAIINGNEVDIDPLNFIESPSKKLGKVTSKITTNETYANQFGQSLTGVYLATDENFSYTTIAQFNDARTKEIVRGNDLDYFVSFGNYYPMLNELMFEQAYIPTEFYKLKLNDIDRLEANQKNTSKDTAGLRNSDILPELYQFWPKFTHSGDNKILFQAFSTKQNSDQIIDLPDAYFDLNQYYAFVIFDGTKAVEISAQELKENVSLFSSNPYLIKAAEASTDGIDLQKKLNFDRPLLTNILGWEWANKTDASYIEVIDPKAQKLEEVKKKKEEKQQEPEPTGPGIKEPAILADNDSAKVVNKDDLNRYSSKVTNSRPAQLSDEIDQNMYYGSEAPWYLQGQLKPEFRKTAADLGLKEEEVYNPNKTKIDSTEWLTKPLFELVAPELPDFEPGYDNGYINPDDPRRKPQEQDTQPWYLKKPNEKKETPTRKPITGKN